MAWRTASAIRTWPGRSAPPISRTAAARSTPTSGVAEGTPERYLAPLSATARPGARPGTAACHPARSAKFCLDRKGTLMTSAEILVDAFGRVQETVHQVVRGLTSSQLAERLAPEANSIAWLVVSPRTTWCTVSCTRP